MIKPDMIPTECFVAYQRAFKRGGGVGDAIAAALNAWPGGQESGMTYGKIKTHIYILPLPMENTNDQA